jgi:transcriptional regulator with XRE-family HTH domain
MPETKETIGQRLKNIRTARQISLDKAAEATRVRAHYLQALESDNYSVMSSAAQSRGFLRLYADYLGLDLDSAMKELSEGDSADALSVASAPAVEIPPPAPLTVPQTPPASPADERPVRHPFWARLLRRSVPEERAAESESISESVAVAQEPAPEPVMVEEPAPVAIPEPEAVPTRVRKPGAASSTKKKSATAAKTSKPKTAKPKAAAKSAATSSLANHPEEAKGKKEGKKKASPKARQSKKRR